MALRDEKKRFWGANKPGKVTDEDQTELAMLKDLLAQSQAYISQIMSLDRVRIPFAMGQVDENEELTEEELLDPFVKDNILEVPVKNILPSFVQRPPNVFPKKVDKPTPKKQVVPPEVKAARLAAKRKRKAERRKARKLEQVTSAAIALEKSVSAQLKAEQAQAKLEKWTKVLHKKKGKAPALAPLAKEAKVTNRTPNRSERRQAIYGLPATSQGTQ